MAAEDYEVADDLLAFIDAAPSPWHAAAVMASRLEAMGFEELREDETWRLSPGRGYFVRRGGASLIAFRIGSDPGASGLRIIGAHTDSPGFRVRPQPQAGAQTPATLGVEIYGGPIIATFADRDLGLAGRVWCRGRDGEPAATLYAADRPLVRLPTLAIHLNPRVNEDGLKFQLQDQLNMVFADRGKGALAAFLAAELGHDPEAILGWELALTDTQPGARFGADGEFIANSQIDNLASCHAGLLAFGRQAPARGVTMLACFDHEEVGSESHRGAAGTFLPAVVDRLLTATDAAAQREAIFARSWVVSADMAHAWNPNFRQAYDEPLAPRVNAGPVVKLNAKQRYASDGEGEMYFRRACERAGVPMQRYVHRNDLPCGSTIGPITAARLGIRTVDVGAPMWSMHSARESAGARDPAYFTAALRACLSEV